MPKQRTTIRSSKHVGAVKMLITAFAIAITMAGCTALMERTDAQSLFVPAVTVDMDDRAAPTSVRSLTLKVNNRIILDDATPAPQPARSPSHLR